MVRVLHCKVLLFETETRRLKAHFLLETKGPNFQIYWIGFDRSGDEIKTQRRNGMQSTDQERGRSTLGIIIVTMGTDWCKERASRTSRNAEQLGGELGNR